MTRHNAIGNNYDKEKKYLDLFHRVLSCNVIYPRLRESEGGIQLISLNQRTFYSHNVRQLT